MRFDEPAEAAAACPVLLVVDADPQARARTEFALARRFGLDYIVQSGESASAGLAALEQLATAGRPVAVVAADLHLPGMGGINFLDRAHQLHRDASRVLLVAMDHHATRIPFTELATLQRATALGRIDTFVVKGWVTPEEWLYPQVQEALTAWTLAHRPSHVVYRIVGDQWSPRSHQLRDFLSRNGVPFEFASADTDRGRQLLRDFGIDASRLPAAIHAGGRVLHDPALADLAASHGIATRPSQPIYDLAVLGAGPAGLAAGVYGASEGLRTLVIEPEALGGQAGASSLIRNYLGFTRGVAGAELAHRAWEQAVMFGAEFMFTQPGSRLAARGADRVVTFREGTEAVARAVLIAVGVTYRRLPIPPSIGSSVAGCSTGLRAWRPPLWPATRCTSWAGPTQLVRPPCTWPSSPPGSPCSSAATHWQPACPPTSSPRSRRPPPSTSGSKPASPTPAARAGSKPSFSRTPRPAAATRFRRRPYSS